VNVFVNGQPAELPEGTTVAEMLSLLKMPPRGVAVEVNLAIVPARKHSQHRLAEGDRLEVVSLVGGG
jgi:sulfur carrier protein